MNAVQEKKKIKKLFKIIIIVFAAVLLLLFALIGVYNLISGKVDTHGDVSGIVFAPADYDLNIFENEIYLSKERDIYYSEYGSGELIDDGNYEIHGDAAVFFKNYFDCVINGRYEEYPDFFTDSFFQKHTIPEKFTMQMIYDIKVNLHDRQYTETNGVTNMISYFVVDYKIMNNNGTFRGDVESDTVRSLFFVLSTVEGVTKISALNYVNYS